MTLFASLDHPTPFGRSHTIPVALWRLPCGRGSKDRRLARSICCPL